MDQCDKSNETSSEDNFTILSWNMEGLNEDFLKMRTEAIIDTIKDLKPSVVFLQEVVPFSLSLLQHKLEEEYQICYPGYHKLRLSYYCSILLNLKAFVIMEGTEVVHWFPGSSMGRHALCLCATSLFKPFCVLGFMNTHLESTRKFEKERLLQLKTCFNLIKNDFLKSIRTLQGVFFGGDLNIYARELDSIIPEDAQDIWRLTGSPESFKFTYDGKINSNICRRRTKRKQFFSRYRFDRFFWTVNRRSKKGHLVWSPESIQFVGNNALPAINMFPSDHFGVFIRFKHS